MYLSRFHFFLIIFKNLHIELNRAEIFYTSRVHNFQEYLVLIIVGIYREKIL